MKNPTNTDSIANKPIFLLSRPARFISALVLCTSLPMQNVLAQESVVSDSSDSLNYSAGLTLGSNGLGATFSGKTHWSFSEGDQVQWRVVMSGVDFDLDSDDEVDIKGIDYDDVDFSLFALQGGLDWYPVQSGWADEVFVSAGLMYVNSDFTGQADNSKSYYVGDKLVNPGDITSLTTKIENSEVLPYLSIGWGNKITKERGFDFQAEVGVAMSTKDADVRVTAVDPNNILSAMDLAAEKKQIEDDIDGAMGFVSATVSYHF